MKRHNKLILFRISVLTLIIITMVLCISFDLLLNLTNQEGYIYIDKISSEYRGNFTGLLASSAIFLSSFHTVMLMIVWKDGSKHEKIKYFSLSFFPLILALFLIYKMLTFMISS